MTTNAMKVRNRPLDQYQVTVSGSYLSDLFFNFDLENYKAFMKGRADEGDCDETALDLDNPSLREALMKDAENFASCVGMSGDVDFKTACVEDFLERV